jgi:hypothetical protein
MKIDKLDRKQVLAVFFSGFDLPICCRRIVAAVMHVSGTNAGEAKAKADPRASKLYVFLLYYTGSMLTSEVVRMERHLCRTGPSMITSIHEDALLGEAPPSLHRLILLHQTPRPRTTLVGHRNVGGIGHVLRV